jgi:hypothetical protein
MEFSEQDKRVLDMAQQLIWQKGVNNPLESQIANAMTQLAQRIISSKQDQSVEQKR